MTPSEPRPEQPDSAALPGPPADLGAAATLLDDVAALVGAPALVEDVHHVVVAYSRHDQPGDQVRQGTILRRRADPAVVEWLSTVGISRATGPLRVPANPRLGMLPRVCLPLRLGSSLVGYLWFIDEDMDMSLFELERAWQASLTLAELLWRGGGIARLVPATTMRGLLAGTPPEEPEVEHLRDVRLEFAGRFRVVALRADPPSATALRIALTRLLEAPPGPAPVGALLDDGAALLFVEQPGTDSATQVRDGLGASAGGVVAGLGDAVADLDQIPLAARTARDAARCGWLWPELSPVVDWTRSGLHRQAAEVARGGSGPVHELVERLGAMLTDDDLRHLVLTAETYLDLAGHAQATARTMVMHRTTLYQRLQRFSDRARVDLGRGEDRTMTHLAIKAARFHVQLPHGSDQRRPRPTRQVSTDSPSPVDR